MLLRPVHDTEEDAEAVRALMRAAFAAPSTGPGDARPVPAPSPEREARGREKVRHLVRTSPGGSWLAEDAAGRPVGAAQAVLREGTWGLALLVVLPEARGKGVGGTLLSRARELGRHCLRGIICCSTHPAAARAYRRAGFTLHPTMRLHGTLDPSRLAAPDKPAVVGSAAHRDLMDSVDRRLRGGAHGPDHEFLVRHCRLFVSDDLAGSGYCYLTPEGKVELLAATSRRLATRLLTTALLSLPEGAEATVHDLTAEQQWAVDVGLAAGLGLTTAGWVCLRGMRPPSPYVPSGSFL
ncbi:GNAT family N-acetyltransferase [Streptomyces daliensis]|uniref:GNAT family N-acetyltransferase n=1 Tax=Streptomyces daliensis TaxID=299421 RepID=A0A8T4IN25_9ACTN|nr:GNAT family N-acetyltransferase [Streptomyces daliensis]